MEKRNKQIIMKQIFITILSIFTLTSYGQDKNNYTHFNKLTEVEGTDYVIASVENWGKIPDAKNKYLLFINTKNGQTKQVDFPSDGYFEKLEQVKIDHLGINQLLFQPKLLILTKKRE
jgi:hypothetical protein